MRVCLKAKPGVYFLTLVRQLRDSRPGIGSIILTGQGTIGEAVEATKLGAFSFLEKPLDPKRLQVELRNCVKRHENERQLEIAHRRLRDFGLLGSLVGPLSPRTTRPARQTC